MGTFQHVYGPAHWPHSSAEELCQSVSQPDFDKPKPAKMESMQMLRPVASSHSVPSRSVNHFPEVKCSSQHEVVSAVASAGIPQEKKCEFPETSGSKAVAVASHSVSFPTSESGSRSGARDCPSERKLSVELNKEPVVAVANSCQAKVSDMPEGTAGLCEAPLPDECAGDGKFMQQEAFRVVNPSLSPSTLTKGETVTGSTEAALSEAFRLPGYRYERPGLFSGCPQPAPRHKPLTINEMFDHIKPLLEELPSRAAVGPTLLLHFLYRHCLKIADSDFGVVRNFQMQLKARRPQDLVQNPRHCRGFPVAPAVKKILEEMANKNVDDGIWQEHQYTVFSSQIFGAIKNSDVRMKEGKLTEIPNLTHKHVRLVVDCSKLNEICRPIYVSQDLAALRSTDIGHFLRGSNLISSYDISSAFTSMTVAPQCRPLLGLKLAPDLPTYRSNVALQGLTESPAAYIQSFRRAQDDRSRRCSLVYMDDVLIAQGSFEETKEQDRDKEALCPKCLTMNCDCPKGPIPELLQMDWDEIKQSGLKLNAFTPDDQEEIARLFKKFDPHGLLPRDAIMRDVFTVPLDKGIIWADAVNFELPGDLKMPKEREIPMQELRRHFENLTSVLATVQRHGSKINISKSNLMQDSVVYYGRKFAGDRCYVPEKRINFFRNLKGKIQTTKDVHSFLGALLFISGHIQGLAHFTKPLYATLSRPKNANLTEEEVKLCHHLIDKVETAPPLALPSPEEQLYLVTDASALALAATLGTMSPDGKIVPCMYWSKILSDSEARRLTIIEKELFAASSFILSNLDILQGKHPVVLVTDNRALHLLLRADEVAPHSRLAKCLHILRAAPISLKVHHRKGNHPSLFLSDALSRLPYGTMEGSEWQKEAKLLQEGNDEVPRSIVGKIIPMSELPHLTHQSGKQLAIPQSASQSCSKAEWQEHQGDARRLQLINVQAISRGLLGETHVVPKGASPKDTAELFVASLRNAKGEQLTRKEIISEMDKAIGKTPLTLAGIMRDQKNDPKWGPTINELLGANPPSKRKTKKYTLTRTFLLARKGEDGNPDKIVLPEDSALLLLTAIHAQAHLGRDNLVKVVREHFHVEGLGPLAEIVAKSCSACLLHKVGNNHLWAHGRNIRGTHFGDVVSCDHVILPPCAQKNKRYQAAMVFVDTFSKLYQAYPVTNIGSREAVRALGLFVQHYGAPKLLISDNASTFISAEFHRAVVSHGIRHSTGLAYSGQSHPIERSNLIFVRTLNIIQEVRKTTDWVSILPQTLSAMRAMPQLFPKYNPDGSIGYQKCSTNQVLFGRAGPSALSTLLEEIGEDSHADLIAQRDKLQDEIRRALEEEKARFDQEDERRRAAMTQLVPGQYVMIRALPRQKHAAQFARNIYRVIAIHKRKVTARAVFHNPRKATLVVHIRYVKPVAFHAEAFAHIPPSLRRHLAPLVEPEDNARAPRNLPDGLRSSFNIPAVPPKRVLRQANHANAQTSDSVHVPPSLSDPTSSSVSDNSRLQNRARVGSLSPRRVSSHESENVTSPLVSPGYGSGQSPDHITSPHPSEGERENTTGEIGAEAAAMPVPGSSGFSSPGPQEPPPMAASTPKKKTPSVIRQLRKAVSSGVRKLFFPKGESSSDEETDDGDIDDGLSEQEDSSESSQAKTMTPGMDHNRGVVQGSTARPGGSSLKCSFNACSTRKQSLIIE
jgi:hypothetical protein